MTQANPGKNRELPLLEEMWRQRKGDKIGPLFLSCADFTQRELAQSEYLLASSPTDGGVWRNGGRRGSCHGPQAITHQLKMLAREKNQEKIKILDCRLLTPEEENDFAQGQRTQAGRWANILKHFSGKKLVHLGGGHDHIYPLLTALSSHFEQIFVLNVDAHLDARTDQLAHSGTPFRQMDGLKSKAKISLVQYGIHDFANSLSTRSPLKSGKVVLTYDDILQQTRSFRQSPQALLKKVLPKKVSKKMAAILSVDCDGLEASGMEGVSAVNPQGLPLIHVQEVAQIFKKHFAAAGLSALGLYEYNPLYDSLNARGAKWISAQAHDWLFKK